MNNEAIGYLVDPNREDLTAPKLAKMKDHDVEILCKNLHRVESPAVAAVAADPAAVPPVVAVAAVDAHRIYITQLAEDRLKTACFIACHLVRCQCQPMAASITLQWLDDWTIQRDEEKNHTDPVEHPELLKSDAINDTFFSTVESWRGNTASHIYATDFRWSHNFPIKSKSDAHETLDEFFHCYGVPSCLINDNAKELTQGKFASVAWHAHCHMDLTDPYSPFQNCAESEIHEIKWLAGQ